MENVDNLFVYNPCNETGANKFAPIFLVNRCVISYPMLRPPKSVHRIDRL
ncbi:hypothetical protein MNBD_GAMMA08-374, partial [hydrothermal vent metagenome]